MAKLDKDIKQKEFAIRYCLLTGLIPFVEVLVENRRELSNTSTVITDADLLGVGIDYSGKVKRVAFDCKTLGKTSPINRAFWAAGLMRYIDCDEAFVILRKKASEAHRLSAKYIDVHLFSEEQFINYAESYSINFRKNYCYSSNIDHWIDHAKIYDKANGFEKFGDFLNNETPKEKDPSRGVKRLLAALKKGKGEFNPEKNEHKAIFLHAVLVFSFLMSQIVHDLKNVIDFDADQKDYERILKFYIWGGRDEFNKWQRMITLFAENNVNISSLDPELNEWPSFVELTRKLMDSPLSVFECCQPLRDLSLKVLVPKNSAYDQHLADLISSSTRTRQFVVSQAKYLVKAANLPNEFESDLSQTFDELRNLVTTKK